MGLNEMTEAEFNHKISAEQRMVQELVLVMDHSPAHLRQPAFKQESWNRLGQAGNGARVLRLQRGSRAICSKESCAR